MTTTHVLMLLTTWFICLVLILVAPNLRKRVAIKAPGVRIERRRLPPN